MPHLCLLLALRQLQRKLSERLRNIDQQGTEHWTFLKFEEAFGSRQMRSRERGEQRVECRRILLRHDINYRLSCLGAALAMLLDQGTSCGHRASEKRPSDTPERKQQKPESLRDDPPHLGCAILVREPLGVDVRIQRIRLHLRSLLLPSSGHDAVSKAWQIARRTAR